MKKILITMMALVMPLILLAQVKTFNYEYFERYGNVGAEATEFIYDLDNKTVTITCEHVVDVWKNLTEIHKEVHEGETYYFYKATLINSTGKEVYIEIAYSLTRSFIFFDGALTTYYNEIKSLKKTEI